MSDRLIVVRATELWRTYSPGYASIVRIVTADVVFDLDGGEKPWVYRGHVDNGVPAMSGYAKIERYATEEEALVKWSQLIAALSNTAGT